MTFICPGIGIIALLIALLWWWLRRNRCQHDISLRNVATSTNAYEVRVSAYTPGAQIVNASVPANWIQTTNFPTSVLWKPVAGGPIPAGNPLPGPFSIWVQSNANPDKRVKLEWLTIGGKEVICKQILRVGCGENPDLVPDDEPIVDTGTAATCRCLSAETESDEDSNQFAEPDLSVDLGTPVQTGTLQVEVPYSIEVEPPTLIFTRQWDVTVLDSMGDEQLITIPFTDNLTGQATFTLPGPGSYNFYLTVTDPATCVSATDRDEDEYSDTDFAEFKTAAGVTKMKVKAELCDPLTYHFTNESSSDLSVVDWTVDGVSVQTGGETLDYTFSSTSLGGSFSVCLNTSGGTACETITPTASQNIPKFSMDYDSCSNAAFPVQFYNESTAISCDVKWVWDFGDGSPLSNDFEPQHTYTGPGPLNPTVTLTMTDPITTQSFVTQQTIHLSQWLPDINFSICSDGHVIYETTADDPMWRFPDGEPGSSNEKTQRVCYEAAGPKIVRLYAVNQDGGHCETLRDLSINNFLRCCRHDKTKEDVEFDYGGRHYRLRTRLRCYNGLHPIVRAKSKLQRLSKKGHWFRRRANQIQIELGGNIYTGDDQSGCYCAVPNKVIGSKTKNSRARVVVRYSPHLGEKARMQEGSVTSTHTVWVDANDVGSSITLKLWEHDCGC